MNTLIYDITENFDFTNLKVENPALINANNYFSKIYNNNSNKNFYIKLPKCKTKNGIVNSNNKCFCELEFNSNEKIVAEFFENLEEFCVEEICRNKALWFYDSDNISNEDIQEYITPIMRSYKGGKKFLIKTNIKQDKLITYDENEKKINLTDYDVNNELIPLLNINGIKFSKSTFIIDIILVQFMVLYPCDSFENQILIKLNKKEFTSKTREKEEKEDNLEDNLQDNLEDNLQDNLQNNLEEYVSKTNKINCLELSQEKTIHDSITTKDCSVENKLEQLSNNINENDSFKYLTNTLETIECNKDGSIELINLDTIAENTEPIEIKTHETIYLEIYKKAKQKAKEIRKNAVEAFLEAKNIKMKYNLNAILDDSSSDEENELFNLN
jgi:hypothetical protein